MSERAGKKYILHLPKWYPHVADPQNGVFIQKQIRSLPVGRPQVVLFVKSLAQHEAYRIHTTREGNVETVLVTFRESENSKYIQRLLHVWRYFRAFRKGMRHILSGKGRPALIHVHVLLRTGLLAKYFARKYRISYVVSEHWSGYVTGAFLKKPLLYRYMAMRVLDNAATVIVVSQVLKKAMMQLGVPEQKLTLVPNVVEMKSFEGESRETKNDRIIILSVADLVDDIKKIGEVIEVAAELSQNHNIKYRIIGDGPDRQKLISVARDRGVLDSVVEFSGRLPNSAVLDAIGKCDFLVVNSVVETFSVVTAEALLAGKPVVATRCGGPEMFLNKNNGILIDPGERNALKNAVAKMITTCRNYDPEVVKQTVAGRFTGQNIGRRLEIIYENTIEKSK